MLKSERQLTYAGTWESVGESSHLVEFPSVLLPRGCKPGSIVTITCQRDQPAEQKVAKAFWDLQDRILDTFGKATPEPPVLKLRNVTQTSVALEWEPLKLASSKLLSLAIWRNNQRIALIPNPTSNLSTKMSGLDLDAPYSFHLVLQTTAGCFQSNIVKTRTHKLDNTTGVRVCFGSVQPPELLEACHEWLAQMGAQATENLQIDTTHFVCTGPGSSPSSPSGSQLYQRAIQMSIPTVTPAWLEACVHEKRLAAVKNFVLGKSTTTPTYRRSGSASASKASLGSNRQAAAVAQPTQNQPAPTQPPAASSTTPPPDSAPEPASQIPDAAAPSTPTTAVPVEAKEEEREATATEPTHALSETTQTQAISEEAPENTTEDATENTTEDATENTTENTTEDATEDTTEKPVETEQDAQHTNDEKAVELQTPVETPVESDQADLEQPSENERQGGEESKGDEVESTGDMEDVKL